MEDEIAKAKAAERDRIEAARKGNEPRRETFMEEFQRLNAVETKIYSSGVPLDIVETANVLMLEIPHQDSDFWTIRDIVARALFRERLSYQDALRESLTDVREERARRGK